MKRVPVEFQEEESKDINNEVIKYLSTIQNNNPIFV
jgi:hypothetical protein